MELPEARSLAAAGGKELMRHQGRFIESARAGHRTYLLADEPGLGKTAQALLAAQAAQAYPLLCVVPSVVKTNWAREAACWTPSRSVTVVHGSGEEIDAEFSDAALPPLPAGWKRDYFFYADGFVKDMDFYEALPFTVAQLPFHEMSAYPYSSKEHYPDNTDTLNYTLDWNDRFESGDRTQPYQFRYRPSASEPINDQP